MVLSQHLSDTVSTKAEHTKLKGRIYFSAVVMIHVGFYRSYLFFCYFSVYF